MGKPGSPTHSFLGEASWSGRAYVESSDVLQRNNTANKQTTNLKQIIFFLITLLETVFFEFITPINCGHFNSSTNNFHQQQKN